MIYYKDKGLFAQQVSCWEETNLWKSIILNKPEDQVKLCIIQSQCQEDFKLGCGFREWGNENWQWYVRIKGQLGAHIKTPLNLIYLT